MPFKDNSLIYNRALTMCLNKSRSFAVNKLFKKFVSGTSYNWEFFNGFFHNVEWKKIDNGKVA